MSQTNEPPLAFESWKIVAKLNDGTDIILEPDDLRKSLRYEIEEVISECIEFRIDHLKGKYSEEIYGQQEQEELNESYKQSLANKKERETDDSSEN